MTDSPVAGLCRITVRTPVRSIDLAVPTDVPVADLLPTLLGYGGDDLEESGIEHGGWVLQRLGGAPLDEEHTIDAAGLRDGETIFLRPRAEMLPEPHFDDLVDGVAVTMDRRPYAWTPERSRRVLIGLAVAPLLVGLVVLALPGLALGPRIGVAFGGGLLVLAGAASASRAVGDAGAGAALGFMAALYWAFAGWLLPGGALQGDGSRQVLGARLLASSAAGAGGAVLALALVAAFAPLFMALTTVAVGGATGGALMIAFDLPLAHMASVLALLAVVLGAFVPTLSFRLSGLRVPPIPTNAQQLQEGIDPHPSAYVAARTVLTDWWMTALFWAVGLVCAALLTVMAYPLAPPEASLAAMLSLLLLLHGRGMGGLWQRLALIGPGAYGALALTVSGALALAPNSRLGVLVALFGVAAAMAIAAWTVPGARLVPYWGRAGEVLHSLAAVSLLPLALWVLGVYGRLRGLNG